MDSNEAREQFKEAFLLRSNNDYRKYQEFTNLVKGFARLDGATKVSVKHLMMARELFEESLATLTDEFNIKAMAAGVDYDLVTGFELAKQKGLVFSDESELRRAGDMTKAQIKSLVEMGAFMELSDGTIAVSGEFDWNKVGGKE